MAYIKITLEGAITGETKEIVMHDSTSPNNGYTQAHADRFGKKVYEEDGRASELWGDHDFWEWKKSEYVTEVEACIFYN